MIYHFLRVEFLKAWLNWTCPYCRAWGETPWSASSSSSLRDQTSSTRISARWFLQSPGLSVTTWEFGEERGMNQTDCSLQTNTDATTATLRALLQQMCRVPVDVLRPHFPLLVTHILRALSHMEIRSISIISQLATSSPLAVCGICRSRFSRSCCSRIPPCAEAPQTCSPISSICWAAPSGPTGIRLISSRQSDISLRFAFRKRTSIMLWIFAGASTQHDCWIQHDRSQFEPWGWKNGQSDQLIGDLSKCKQFVARHIMQWKEVCVFVQSDPFYLPVLTSTSSALSPFECTANLLALSQAVTPLVAASIMDDTSGVFLDSTLSIVRQFGKAVQNRRCSSSTEETQFKVSWFVFFYRRNENEKWMFCRIHWRRIGKWCWKLQRRGRAEESQRRLNGSDNLTIMASRNWRRRRRNG